MAIEAKPTRSRTETKPIPSSENNTDEDNVARDLRLLKAILEGSSKPRTISKAPVRPKAPLAAAPHQNRRVARPTKNTGKIEVEKPHAVKGELLPQPSTSPNEQKKLATDCFNQNLKILSAVARKRQDSRSRKTKDGLDISDGSARCDTQQMTEIKDDERDGLIKNAECACAALGVLRLHDDQDRASNESRKKREQGAVLLLDKMITIGLRDTAHSEVSRIHEHYWKRTGPASQSRSSRTMSKPEIALLLSETRRPENKADFEALTAFQSQVLRLTVLYGPAAMNEDFVKSVKITSEGSPADIILSAHNNGFMVHKAAGQNLRTISQALSVIYTATMKSTQLLKPGQDLLALDLLSEALLIRLASWQLLGHQPDLLQEIWTPVERAVRVLWGKQVQEDLPRYTRTKFVIEKLQHTLRERALDSELPKKLSLLFVKLAECNEDSEYAMLYLNKLQIQSTGIEKLCFKCRVAVISIQDESQVDVNHQLQELMQSFCATGEYDANFTAEDLVTIVRLRKACHQRIRLCIDKGSTTLEQEIEHTLVRILGLIFKFCCSFSGPGQCEKSFQNSLHLALLKTLEAILDIEKYVVSVQPPMLHEYLCIVETCMEPIAVQGALKLQLTELQNHQSILSALQMRVSNIFWRAHLDPPTIRDSHYTAIELARTSILYLEELPPEELRKAALGPRLEKLSDMCLQTGDFEAAVHYARRAIQHYIQMDALVDAVEASLTKSSQQIWVDHTTLTSQLGRALHAHSTAFLGKSNGEITSDCIYDDETLPPIHRAVLLEEQVSYLLRKYSTLWTFHVLQGTIDRVMGLIGIPQYRVWALRFVSLVVFRASMISDSNTSVAVVLKNLIDKALNLETQEANVFLKSYCMITETLLKIQRQLITEISYQNGLRPCLEEMYKTIGAASALSGLGRIVDDIDMFTAVLRAYTEQTFTLRDYETTISCLLIDVHVESCRSSADDSVLMDRYIRLALCQIRLDRVELGRASLTHAENLQKSDVSVQAVDLQLAFAEYYLAVSMLDGCRSSLIKAGSAFEKIWPNNTILNSNKQIERDHLTAKAASLASSLALRQGDLSIANKYARQATKISISIWSALEKRIFHTQNGSANDSSIGNLTHNLSKLNIVAENKSVSFQSIGTKYWPYLDLHINSIKHLAYVLCHVGLSEDALHYLKQMKLLAHSLSRAHISLTSAPDLSLLHAKAGRKQEAAQLIDQITALLDDEVYKYRCSDVILSCCEALVIQGELSTAQSLILKLPAIPNHKLVKTTHADQNEKEKTTKVKARRGVAVKVADKMPPKRHRAASKPAAMVTSAARPVQNQELFSFNQAHRECRRRAIIQACNTDSTDSQELIEHIRSIASLLESPHNLVQELYEEAKLMLSQGWHALNADSFGSVLTESAMALPCRSKAMVRKPRPSFLQGGGNNIDIDVLLSSGQSIISDDHGVPFVAQALQCALKICRALLNDRVQHCSTDMIHSLVKMEARILLLLTSMNLPFIVSSTDLVLKASQPRDCALERESIVSAADQATQDRSALSVWPSISLSKNLSSETVTEKQLNDLPSSWSIVSLTLAEGNDELLLSKTVKGRDPFLVRIPLRRSNEGDSSNDFSFEEAKAEMRNIIRKADSSSHDIRGTADKTTRALWHTDRETLDRQLSSLLENMESIWLGGFRGILTPYTFDDRTVGQFRQSLTDSLNKNLPSRQKSSTAEERVEIHDHILEVFLGLGDPEEDDLDDSIMDLLYFVVDILQFNGERNAYDEIEWDAILVDVLDALRGSRKMQTESPRHTILIVDKELELFPWEALPCLINHPVSRMPSLGAIFERIVQMRARSSERNPTAYTISTSCARGAYVLNPSGDLTGTQTLFEPILHDNLPAPNYTPFIDSQPTETQFSSLLQNSDILLYIGHGSGAQYIRPRTIRALSSCAVTFLFGCSSAKMTEHGVFENTGMPRAYMLGHAPAVVGCLWDVTDREIDRVALRTMVSWGLVDGDDERVQEGLRRKGRKGKGKAQHGGSMAQRKKKTLIEAVKDGREACVLRYLCGAAVVVYGIPVILE